MILSPLGGFEQVSYKIKWEEVKHFCNRNIGKV